MPTERTPNRNDPTPRRIAIIGAAHRLPGTADRGLWHQLRHGADLLSRVAADRWDAGIFQHPDAKQPGTTYTDAAGSLGDVAGFDHAFFGISPREAAHMDPQQRIMLELAWEALEDAGIPPSQLRGSECGVYTGVASLDYSYRIAEDPSVIDTPTATGNTSSVIANRISHALDLHGPSLSLDTACSSALVAFHQACQAIRSGEITTALTGAVSLHLHPLAFILFAKANMLSPTGRSHVFDARADGYVRSEGAGLFLLKELEQAQADGDRILATVAASAANADGHTSGLTVPGSHAQAALMEKAQRLAGISAEELDYLEAHGTGTAVGDPVEAEAIATACGRQRRQPLPIGSVKGNLGHLETAAGVASLAKALGAIAHHEIPPTIGLDEPNPRIPFAAWNLDPVTERRALPRDGTLHIGINGFGFGGANAHIILASPPATPTIRRPDPPGPGWPLRISARSEAALQAHASALGEHLREHTPAIYDVAATLLRRRDQLEANLVVFARDAAEAAEALAHAGDTGEAPPGAGRARALQQPHGPVFLYTGNGCQWDGMGRTLLAESELVRETIDEIQALYPAEATIDLRAELQASDRSLGLAATARAQPALFALQVAITRLLAAHGIEPTAVTGHSVGEVAAAWACGALSLQQAVQVIHHRSQQQERTRGLGGMTAASTSADAAQALIAEQGLAEVHLAADNAPHGITLSGDEAGLARIEAQLAEQRVPARRLDLDYPFHSPAMDAIREPLTEALADLAPSPARIPFISTVTGGPLAGDELDAHYWWRNIREPVRFHDAVASQIDDGANVLVEIGAHPLLERYAREALAERERDGRLITSLSRDRADSGAVRSAAATVVATGCPTRNEAHFPAPTPLAPLPPYPWQRERHWIQPSGDSWSRLHTAVEHPLLGYRLPGTAHCWQGQLDTSRLPWLADHQVGGATVFPAAGFAELAAAAAAGSPAATIAVEDLEVHDVLVLDGRLGKRVRTSVDQQRGRIRVEARDPAAHEPWHQHASARIAPQPLARHLAASAPCLPERAPDVTREAHQQRAHALGLDYGPAFQALAALWLEGDTAIARLERGQAIDDAAHGTVLEPPIIDSAFQLFIGLLGEDTAGPAYLPVRLERLQHRTGGGPASLARGRLRARGPHSLCADFELFDGDGRLLTLIEGARFQAMPLRAQGSHPLVHLQEALTPRPLRSTPEAGLPALPGRPLAEAFDAAVAAGYTDEIEPLLDRLAEAFAAEAFANLADDGWLAAERVGAWRAASATADACWERVLALLADAGRTERDPSGWRLLPEDEPIAARTIWQLLIREHPEAAPLTHRLGRAGLHLPGLLTGDAGADAPRFDPSEATWLTRHAGTTRAWRCAADHIAASVRHGQAQLGHGERLALVIAGSQAPLLAQALAETSDLADSDLHILADGEDARREAERLTDQHPTITVATPEQAREGQHPRANLAVVAVDACSRQRSLSSLQAVADATVAGAPVLALGVQPAPWMGLIIEDAEPLDAEALGTALSGLGFHAIDSLGPIPAHGAYALTARAPTTTEADDAAAAATWRIAHDAATAEIAAGLAERLRSRGQAAEPTEAPHYTPGGHLIDLAGLVDPAKQAGQRCQHLLERFQALEAAGTPTRVWLITTGVAGSLDQRATTATEPAEDTALWGMARSLQNEARATSWRLADLALDAGAAPSGAALDTLAASLVADDAETELVISADGARQAPRLRECPPLAPRRDDSAEQAVSLAFEAPGRLTSLAWQAQAQRAPGPEEVSVAVEATGLNFRDVMYTLGMLSDEAIESGFTGATLGLEFAGTVTAIGAQITELAVGDPVVGFGPASFSSHVTVSAQTVAHRPPGLSAEAAATIPTAFFTAYYGLHHLAQLQPGERVLIHGAAGGVGLAAIQIADWLGAEVYASVGSPGKGDFLRLSGIERLYDSRSLSFREAIEADTGDDPGDDPGVDAIVNVLAGQAIEENLRLLKPFGRLLELGKRDFYEDTPIGLRPFRNNLSYFGVDADQLLRHRPAYARRLFSEVIAGFRDGRFHPLPYVTFANDRVVDAFRYMQQARQIGKIVVSHDRPVTAQGADAGSPAPAAALPAQRTWIVTGGLTGFGRRTAEWLAEQGVTHLLLLSRRGAEHEEGRACLDALHRRGVSVQAPACDITDRHALAAVLDRCRAAMPPIGGVVHAAAVIDDALAQNTTTEQLQRVLAAKVEGARHLDALTRNDPLAHFILYASATTLLGTPGQSSYVAANRWLEGLAAARRARGAPALCLQWGAISDAGFLARQTGTRDALQQRLGGSSLTADEALAQLGDLMASPRPTTAVLRLDWRTLARGLPQAGAPRLSQIASRYADDAASADADRDWPLLLAEGSAAEQREALVALVRQELANILLLDADQLDMDRPLEQLGLDSLMGVELVTALEGRTGMSIPAMALSEAATPSALVDQLLERLTEARDEAGADRAPDELAALAERHGVAELAPATGRQGDA